MHTQNHRGTRLGARPCPWDALTSSVTLGGHPTSLATFVTCKVGTMHLHSVNAHKSTSCCYIRGGRLVFLQGQKSS